MMHKKTLIALLMCLSVMGCTIPAYVLREYTHLAADMTKTEFRMAVEEKNKDIRADEGYMKLYDLVKVDRSIRKNLYLEEWLFAESYALAKDSSLIRSNLIRLSSIKGRIGVWPSVYQEMYGNKLNPNYWTAWMNKEKQRAIRDSIDMSTTPILKASKYKLDPKFYIVYKMAMRVNKANAMKAK